MDGTLGEAHSSLAGVFMDYSWNWLEVEREYKRALELSPGYAIAHQWYGNFLSAMGRSEEAIHSTLRARQLDPLSLIINTNKDKAFEWLEKSYAERARALGFAKVEPRLDALRSDPRFIELLQRMGLPDHE